LLQNHFSSELKKKPHAFTAVRFSLTASDDYKLLRLVVSNVVDCGLNSSDFFSFFVRDFGLEFLFQSHHQLNGVKGVSTQVFNEGSSVYPCFVFNAQLLGNDVRDALFEGAPPWFSLLRDKFRPLASG
jgi:hypothetical protein